MSLASALRTRDPGELPPRRAEAWRWSDLRGAIGQLPPTSPPAGVFGHSPFAGIAGTEVVFVNGRRADGCQNAPDAQYGRDATRIVPLRPYRDGSDGRDSSDDLFVLRLRFLSDATRTGHVARFSLTVPAGGRGLLLESYEGRGDGYVSDVALMVEVGEGATLDRLIVADEPESAVSVSTATIAIAGGASFRQTTLVSGARLQRLETHLRHPGAQAAVRLDGLYLLGEGRHADLTSTVTHEGEGGTTSQLTKGVVADRARGVFQGRITVEKGADRTDARMGHHALLLSDRAEVDAKPELEIWADDVSCAHGNTVGALDEDALFYARSRGIPEPDARALLTEAFLGEVIERVEHLGARDVFRACVERRLSEVAR